MHDSYIDDIKAAVIEANTQCVLPRFRNPAAQGLNNKTHDYDLVTLADKEAEALLIKTLKPLFPTAYIVGEETISVNSNAINGIYTEDLTLLLDPVDGTLNFTQGSPIFGTIVSVLRKGEPVAGLLYDPLMNDWVIAEKGSGAYYQNAQATKRLFQEPVRVPVFINNLSNRSDSYQALDNVLGRDYGIFRNFWSSAHDYRFMAMGSATGFLSLYCKPWDHAAGSVILEESGGKVAFLDGAPYTITRDTGPLLATQNTDAFEDIRQRLRPIF